VLRLARQFNPAYPACDSTQNGLTFHSSDHLPGTYMNARTEPDMANTASPDIEPVRFVPLARIAVR
jgi:hypothetical protein